MKLPNGINIVGNLSGTDTRQWQDRNGQTRYNHFLILSDTYQDRYGNPQTNVYRVGYAEDRMQEMQKFANDNPGEPMSVLVNPTARQGRDGAFITYFIPTDAFPKLVVPDVS